MAERGTRQVVDSDGEDERRTSHGKGEVVRVVDADAEVLLRPLHDFHGYRGCEEGADIDGHVEDGEAGVSLVGILRVVVKVAYHHLEVALEHTRSEADEQQGGQHDDECERVTAERHGEQHVAGEHDHDAPGDHLAKAELIGHPATDEGKEIDEHEEIAVDFACPAGIKAVVSTQKQCKDGKHGVVTESLAGVGQCQRVKSFWLSFEHSK